MAQNNRMYFAAFAVGIAKLAAPTTFVTARGVQTVGVSTRFNLEQIFEVGQLAIYENAENLPDVEVSLEKCLDGYPLIYHLCTEDAVSATLVGRSNQRACVAISFFQDTNTQASGSGTQLSQCFMSGVYVSQVGYDIDVNGPSRESVTLVGNNKVWTTGSFTYSGFTSTHGVTSLSPASASGINRRQDIVMTGCLWPTEIPGISASGLNVPVAGSGFSAHIQKISASVNLGRDQMFELGSKAPYFRYVTFPVEVSTSIDIFSQQGDMISATEAGVLGGGENLSEQRIRVMMQEGLLLDLGTKNKLSNISQSGGDAAGRGNQTLSYNYTTQNDFTVQHSADPTVALRP